MRYAITSAFIWAGVSLGGCQQGSNGGNAGAMQTPNMGSVANLRSSAIGVLEQAASSDHPLLRANAIEALQAAPEYLDAYLRQGLVDENRGVRFVTVMTIGDLKRSDIAHLVEPLLLDQSFSVRAGAIYALRQCGRMVDLNPLAEMLQSTDAEVRGNVAMVLGRLGEPSAAPMIEHVVGKRLHLSSASQEEIVELQLAEALVMLGREEEIDAIRASLFVTPDEMELSALACTMLGRLRDRGSIGALWRLASAEEEMQRPAEVRLAAATALAQLGEPVSADVARAYLRNPQPAIRHQAALTLGAIGTPDVLGDLQGLLEDHEPLVQVAAAGAILRLEP